MAKEEINIIVKTDLGNSTKDIQELNKALEETTERTEKSSEANKEKTKTIKELKDEIEKYQEELLNLTRGGEEYKETINKVAKAQVELDSVTKDLKEVMEELTIANSSNSEKLQTVLDAGSELVKGFSTITSSAQALGMDFGFLSNMLVKVQAGLQLASAINKLDKSFKAFKVSLKATNLSFQTFNATIWSNPIFWLVAAIAAAVAALAFFSGALSENTEETEKLNKEQEDFTATIDKQADAISKSTDLLRAQGASQVEVADHVAKSTKIMKEKIDERVEALDEEIKALEKNTHWWNFNNKKKLEQLKEHQKESKEMQEKANKDLADAEHKLFIERVKEDKKKEDEKKKEADAAAKKREQQKKKELDNLNKLEGKYNDAAEAYHQEQQRRNKEEEKAQTQREDRVAYVQKEVDESNKLVADLKAGIQELEQVENKSAAQLEQLANYYNELNKAEKENIALNQELATEQENLRVLQKEELEAQKEKDRIEREQRETIQALKEESARINEEEREKEEEDAVKQAERRVLELEQRQLDTKSKIDALAEELKSEELTNEKRIELLEEYNNALRENKALEEEITEAKEELELRKREAAEATFQNASDKLNEAAKLLGEETAAGKAAAVAAATIDTYKAATSAYASLAPIPFVGPALGIAAAAAAVKAGIANVKAILSTKVPAGAGGGSAGGAGTAPTMPNYPSFPDADEPIVETHNNLTATDEEYLNQDRKVYVSEYDISKVQSRVNAVEKNTTF